MNRLRPTAVDDDRFREIAGVRRRFDGPPPEIIGIWLGTKSLLAAGIGKPTDLLGGVTWEEFLKELQDPQKITQEN